MKKLNIFLLLVVFICITFSSFTFAQLQKLEGQNLHTESDIYLTDNGVRYSDLITLKFNKRIIADKVNPNNININSLFARNAKDYFLSLRNRFGDFKIIKVFLTKVWGDTIAINRRTFKKVKIEDVSQLVQLRFSQLVPIDSIITNLNVLPFIKYAQGPEVMQLSVAPNDPLYSTATHWAFDRINAETAWNITQGSNTISISINDYFYGTPLHEDLVGKVDYVQGQTQNHGGSVAGIAGATTNNGLGVASLGWNVKLMLHTWGYLAVNDAVYRGADVINFSWITYGGYDDPALRSAIHNAILQGVVCVAAAGNQVGNVNYIPSVQYPAAYNFGSDGQVIAVSATQWDGANETFVDGWNYSPGTDPINDPTNSFIDVSAPGMNIEIITGSNTYSPNGAGTSDAAPFVSALVGLMLSVDSTLTPVQVYDIITGTTDKIGQYSYDSNGWNRYMGYGRINAYQALLTVDSSPAVPQNFQVTKQSLGGTYRPKLTWNANTESDLAGYLIERKIDNGAWEIPTNGNVSKDAVSFVDYEIVIWNNSNFQTAYYRMQAYNDLNLYSDYTQVISIDFHIMFKPRLTQENIPKVYELLQNYPNPFNPSTDISYSLKEDGIVVIKVFDVLGKEVAVLKNKYETAGKHIVNFNATNLQSGIYFYRITTGSFHKTRKMLLLK